MIDRRNVIKGLELCEIGSDDRCYETECPYYGQGCTESLKNDILAMLKEQEAIPADTKVIGTFNGDIEVYCCRNCRTILDPAFHYCPNCGQGVKWE